MSLSNGARVAIAGIGLGTAAGAGAMYGTMDHFSSRPEALVVDATDALREAEAQHEAFLGSMPDCQRTVVETVDETGVVGYYFPEDLGELFNTICGRSETNITLANNLDASERAVGIASYELDEAIDATTFSKNEKIWSIVIGAYFGLLASIGAAMSIDNRIRNRRLDKQIQETYEMFGTLNKQSAVD